MKHTGNGVSNFVKNEGLLSSLKIIQNIKYDNIKLPISLSFKIFIFPVKKVT
jgi:hypothetical protein